VKIDKQLQEDHQVKLLVEVETERLEANKHKAARRLARRGKIPGFRPGKAPYDVICRFYGDAAIQEEALDLLVEEIYPKVLEQSEIEPAAPGLLEKVESIEPPKFAFLVPLAPTVDLGNYRAVRLPYDWQPPGEDKVDEAIEELRQMHAVTETVERPIQEGDFPLVDIRGEKEQAADGENPVVIERTDSPLFIRPQQKEEKWPFSGFSRKLIGLSAGESVDITYAYDKDAEDENLRGQSVHFKVNIKTVHGVTLPEVNDEFAKTVGEFENLEKLRQALCTNLEKRSQNEYDDEYYVRLIDKIKEGGKVKYPPQVLEREAGRVLDDIRKRLAAQKLDLETYLKSRQLDEEKYTAEEVRPTAAKRLERSLILNEVARVEKIDVDEPSLKQEFDETVNELQFGGFDFRKLTSGGKRAQERFAEAMTMESANRLLTRRTLERLKALATGQKVEAVPGEDKPRKRAKPPAKSDLKKQVTKKTTTSENKKK